MRFDQASNGNVFRQGWTREQAVMSAHDAEVLRELAKQLRERAERPCEREKYELWRAHNDLEDTRPLLYVDCENGWNEILPIELGTLRCEGEMAQEWELYLQKEILYADKVKDDKPLEARIYLPYRAHDSGWGVDKKIIGDVAAGEAYTWESPITDDMMENDLDLSTLIKIPEITVDHEATDRYTALAHEVFDGVLSVERRHWWLWGTELTHPYADLRGLENMMCDFYDYPEKVHEIFSLFEKGYMAKLDQLEREGLLTANTGNCYVCSGGLGITGQLPGEDKMPRTTMDNWGFNESQETSEVSPEMFAEFVLPYQLRLAARFGLNGYGCCEGLDNRWQYVRQIPRLRRVSVSQWADMERMSELLGGDYVFSYKPSPTDVAVPSLDEAYIRGRLRHVLETAKANGNRVEMIMKDNHTVANRPQNIYRWVEIAREEIARLW